MRLADTHFFRSTNTAKILVERTCDAPCTKGSPFIYAQNTRMGIATLEVNEA